MSKWCEVKMVTWDGFWKLRWTCKSTEVAGRLARRLRRIGRNPHWDEDGYFSWEVWIRL